MNYMCSMFTPREVATWGPVSSKIVSGGERGRSRTLSLIGL